MPPADEPAATVPEAPAPAPIADAAPAPIEAPAPVADAAPAEPAPEPAAPEGVKPAAAEPTLLEGVADAPKPDAAAEKPADAKPADAPADAKPGEEAKPDVKADDAKPDAKPEDIKPPEAAKPEPVKYEAFALPEGITLDEKPLGEATAVLGEFGVPQDKAQKLVELHTNAMVQYAKHLADQQQQAFADTRKSWRTEVMADPVLGGAGFQTAMGAVARMRDMFVPADSRDAFNTFLRVTGAGDNPEFLRLMHRVSQRFDEPATPPAPNGPTPDRGGRAKSGRRGALYDHPTSNNNRANGAR